jgi:hypothetical protein
VSGVPDGTLTAVVALVPLLAGLGLGAVALTGTTALRLPALVLCALGAPGWAATSAPLEGPVLFTVSPQHGLTLSDLLAATAVGMLVLLVLDLRRGS